MSERHFPPGWKVRQLDQIAGSITSGGTPRSGDTRYYPAYGGLPFAKIEDLTASKGHYLSECELHVSEEALNESAAKRYPVGTILISMYGTIGLVKRAAIQLAANQALSALLPPFECDPDYLLHHLDFIRSEWIKDTGQTTQANINGRAVKSRSVPLPPLAEQEKIARVLDVLDTQIRQTEALIAKLERIKQGLLTDLLTRGIDQNGKLRPTPDHAPHLYKDSPLGRIPREWEVTLLDKLAQRGSGHTPSKSVPTYWNGGVRWVSLADSGELDQVYIYETDKEISDLGIANSSATKHRAGTVILSRDAGIGKSAILATEMAVSQHFMAWSCGSHLDKLFLYYWLQWMKPRFEAIALGSTIQTIGLAYFKQLLISAPPKVEQELIAERLFKTEELIRKNRALLGKSAQKKEGLMDDLLTGRVRVSPLLETKEPATA